MEGTTTLDEARLEEFIGQAVTDLGAAMISVLFMIGGKLGLYKAMAGAGPLRPRRSPRAVAPRSARCANGHLPRPRAATSNTTRTRTLFEPCRPSRRWRSPTKTAPSTCSARYDLLGSASGPIEERIAEALQERRGVRLARARSRSSSAARSASSAPATRPTWSPSGSRRSTASRRSSAQARRWPTSAAATEPRRPDGRRRTRSPSSTASTTTPPRSSARTSDRRGRGRRRAHRFQVASAKDFPGDGLRPRASSTACTTWAIRSERSRTSARRSPPTAPWHARRAVRRRHA